MNSLTESVLGTLAGIVLLSTAGVGYHHWVRTSLYLPNYDVVSIAYLILAAITPSTKKKS